MHICVQLAEVLDLDSDVLTEGSNDHYDADPGQHKDQDHAASASTVALLIVVLLLASHGTSACTQILSPLVDVIWED